MFQTNDKIQNSMLIRLIDIENNNYIRSYWTDNFTETLKMYRYIQKEGIDISIDTNDDDDRDKYTDNLANIEDIEVVFGTDARLTCIEIYVRVRDYK